MIAACSRRAKVEAFSFNDVAMSRANLREGVIWLRPESDENQETTQEMADDYIRMACAEVKFMTKPEPIRRAGAEQDPAGGWRRRHRHDLRASRRPRPAIRSTWWRRGQSSAASGTISTSACPSAPRLRTCPTAGTSTCPSRRIRASRTWSTEVDGQRAHHGAPQRQDHQDLRRPGPLLGGHQHRVRRHRHRELRRHRPGHRLQALRRQQAAGIRLRQDPGRGDQLRAREAGQGGRTARLIKRPSDGKEVKSVAFIQCAGQRSTKEGPPALLLRLLLHRVHQAGDVLQGPEPGLRRHGPVRRSAHPRCRRRGLLPLRPAGHGHLLQGQGLRGRRRTAAS